MREKPLPNGLRTFTDRHLVPIAVDRRINTPRLFVAASFTHSNRKRSLRGLSATKKAHGTNSSRLSRSESSDADIASTHLPPIHSAGSGVSRIAFDSGSFYVTSTYRLVIGLANFRFRLWTVLPARARTRCFRFQLVT